MFFINYLIKCQLLLIKLFITIVAVQLKCPLNGSAEASLYLTAGVYMKISSKNTVPGCEPLSGFSILDPLPALLTLES
jgi:hypothetical protein